MASNKSKSRIELFLDMAHYFQAYVSLSEQIHSAAETEHVDSLIKLTDLRQQTQNRIDQLQKKHPELLAIVADQESDPNIIKVRNHIRELVKRSVELSEGVVEKSTDIRGSLKKTIANLTKGKKGMRGYTIGRDKKSRFIETSK